MRLRVKDKHSTISFPGNPATANPSDFPAQAALGASCFLQLAEGSDSVLAVRFSVNVEPGCIHLDEVQQFNLHLLAGGEAHGFRCGVIISHPVQEPKEPQD